MESHDEQKKQGNEKGFAGLSSMVSDIDSTLDSPSKQAQEAAVVTSSEKIDRPVREQQPNPAPNTYQPPQSSGGSKWIIGILSVLGVLWVASQSGNKHSTSPAISSGVSSTPVAPASDWQPQAPQAQESMRPDAELPPVGQNNVLSIKQIRYCLSEKIRLDVAETLINNYAESEVERFNGYVNDYNSRCGEYRYRQGALESAQRDVETYRADFQAEGRARFARSPSVETRTLAPATTLESTPPKPDVTIQAIQRRLNELGLDAGNADGYMGNKTRLAVVEFQKKFGMPVDGLVGGDLLEKLNRIANRLDSTGAKKESRNTFSQGNKSIASESRVNYPQEESTDRNNYNQCIDGRYPGLCKHSLLTQDEAIRVGAAERKANFENCIDGRYPGLCKHSLLTQDEAIRVGAAERKANFENCIDGRYPGLCKHSLLTQDEAIRVGAAERKANFENCIDGRYPGLCKHSLLTQDEAIRVDAAERKANFENCIDGRYPGLCKHSLLTQGEAADVKAAELRAQRR